MSTKNWKTEQPSYKLNYQMASPFEIIEQISNSYRLKLPDSIKIYNVFSPDQLQKATNNPLPWQIILL